MPTAFLSAFEPATALAHRPSAAAALLAVCAVLWILAAVGSARRRAPLFDTRRTIALREAARRDRFQGESRARFRDPGRSLVVFAAEEWERQWWCEKLNVSADALREAMLEVGPMAADVERYFAAAAADRSR